MPKIRYQDFSGGMQNATSRFLQRDNELRLAINVHGDKVGAIKKRLGFKRTGGEVTTDKSPSFIYDGGTFLYTHLDTALKYNNAGTWTAVTGGTPAYLATKYVTMQRFKEIGDLYIAGGTASASTSSDYVRTQKIDAEPTTPGTQADAGTTTWPNARFITRWRDRIYMGWCHTTWVDGGDVTKSNRVWYSPPPAAGTITPPTINDAAFNNYFDIDDPITGMQGTADALIVWTKESMWKWTINSLKNRYPIGCMSFRSVQTVDVYTFWLAKEGIYVESGSKPELISNKIQPIIDAIVNMNLTFAWKDESHYYLYVGALTLDGVAYPNCVIQYSVKSNAFYIYSYTLPTGKVITAGGTFDDGTDTRAYIGTSSGEIFQISHPGDATPVYTDGDQTNETYPIEMKVQTKRYDMGIPEENKTIQKMTLISEYASGTKVRTSTEGGDWKSAGEIQKPIELITFNPPNGKDFSVELSEIGTTQGPEIELITMETRQTSQEHDA